MPLVCYVTYESVLNKRLHEGIFVCETSTSLNLATTTSFTSLVSPPTPPRSSSSASSSARESKSPSDKESPLPPYVPLKGDFLELIPRRNKISSQIKVKHFHELNDPYAQQKVCISRVGVISSLYSFLALLKQLPMPSPESHVVILDRYYAPKRYVPVNPQLAALLPPLPDSQWLAGLERFERPPHEVAREWYVMAIHEAERRQMLRREY